MKSLISELSLLLNESGNEENIKFSEKILVRSIEETVSEDLFYSLPTKEILKIIEQSEIEDINSLCTIARKMSEYKKEDAITLLNVIDSKEATFEDCISVISQFKQCPICERIGQFSEENKNLPSRDYEHELKKLKDEIDQMKKKNVFKPVAKKTFEKPRIVAVEDAPEDCSFGLLLCGAGEAGKTTFTRQLKLKLIGEFSKKERVDFLRTIKINIVDSIICLIKWLQDHDIEIKNKKARGAAEQLSEVDPYDVTFDGKLVEKLKLLWKDETIQEAFKHVDETPIPDNIAYFFDKIDELVAKNYIPTNEDILKTRIRTIGINQITLNYECSFTRIIEVGGQIFERTKWAKVMSQVEGVIFCVSFADFDKPMFEDSSTIRINDSLELFRNISHKAKFQNSPIFLVCNKFDVFAKKVKETDAFKKTFPEYQGDEHDPEACAQYLIEKFMKSAEPLSENRPIIHYKIVALNSDDVINTANDICKFISEKYSSK